MNLAERYTEDEKIAAINKWMETVNEITSETVSLADPNDPLTELDRENYTIVRYKDGTEKRDLSSRDVPSVMYKHIDSIIQSWGLKIKSVDLKDRFDNSITWDGLCYVRMKINNFHTNMFDLTGSWETYHPRTIESIIENYFIRRAEDAKDLNLVREIKIRSLIK
jgi:hypothetical protein